MNLPLARLGIALLALLGPAAWTQAATPDQAVPSKVLRSASVEATPATWDDRGRFRLRARLHAAPAPPVAAGNGLLRIEAALVHKASAAICPAPGSIFSDGFEAL